MGERAEVELPSCTDECWCADMDAGTDIIVPDWDLSLGDRATFVTSV